MNTFPIALAGCAIVFIGVVMLDDGPPKVEKFVPASQSESSAIEDSCRREFPTKEAQDACVTQLSLERIQEIQDNAMERARDRAF